jgi:transglutaminase-like putative cysteine protease
MAIVTLYDDYSPPSQMYYFRQEVWSEFNGSRFVTPKRSDVDRDVLAEYPTLQTPIPDPPPKTGRADVNADVSMLVDHKSPFFLESPVQFGPKPNPNPQRFVRAYRFESFSQALDFRELAGRQAGNPAWSPEVRSFYLAGPTDPRYGELARKVVATLPEGKRKDPFLEALAVKLHFDREFTYSTAERHANAADPTADFLFGNKIGYCVHFAHAAVYLWRSLGIPARIGTGYATTEDDRLGSTILIRSGDAHSWPELYLDGVGWIILDIAAQRNLDPPAAPADKELIRKLAENKDEQQSDEQQPGHERVGRRIRSSSVAWALLALAALGLLALYGVKLWRRLAPLFAGPRTVPIAGYRVALDLLAEAGLSRRLGESRGQFAKRVGERAPSFERLTELNVAARFSAPAAPDPARPEHSRATWRDGLRTMRRELRHGTKLWRRLLGLVDPASFFASR